MRKGAPAASDTRLTHVDAVLDICGVANWVRASLFVVVCLK